MAKFRNLRLGVRLGAVLGVVVAGLLVLTLVGVSSLGRENDTAQSLARKDIPAVKALGQIQFAMVAYRADQLAHAHQTDNAGRADQESQMGDHDAIMNQAFAQYKTLFINDKDRALAASAEKNWEAYKAASSKSLPPSRAGDHAAAYAILKKEVGPLVSLIGDLDKWIAFAEKTRAQHVEAASSTYSSARTILFGAAGLLTLLAIAAVFLVTRSITGPLAELRGRLRGLNDEDLESLAGGLDAAAAGDFTHTAVPVTEPVEVVGKDEIAQLTESFNEMLAKSQRGIASYSAMRDKLGEMIGDVAANAATVSNASGHMATTSSETGRAVGEIASAVGDVAQGTERQVRMVESVRGAAQDAARMAGGGAGARGGGGRGGGGRDGRGARPRPRGCRGGRGRRPRRHRCHERGVAQLRGRHRRHPRSRRALRAHRGDRRHDHRHRRADEPARAQRRDRGGPRRRAGPRLRRRRRGGPQAR